MKKLINIETIPGAWHRYKHQYEAKFIVFIKKKNLDFSIIA